MSILLTALIIASRHPETWGMPRCIATGPICGVFAIPGAAPYVEHYFPGGQLGVCPLSEANELGENTMLEPDEGPVGVNSEGGLALTTEPKRIALKDGKRVSLGAPDIPYASTIKVQGKYALTELGASFAATESVQRIDPLDERLGVYLTGISPRDGSVFFLGIKNEKSTTYTLATWKLGPHGYRRSEVPIRLKGLTLGPVISSILELNETEVVTRVLLLDKLMKPEWAIVAINRHTGAGNVIWRLRDRTGNGEEPRPKQDNLVAVRKPNDLLVVTDEGLFEVKKSLSSTQKR